MKIKHSCALRIEMITREVAQCDRSGIGGLVDADVYGKAPFEAAILCIAYLYDESFKDDVDEFCVKWRDALEGVGICDDETANEYCDELSDLVYKMKNKK